MKNFMAGPMVIAFEKNFPEAILALMTTLYGFWITSPPDSLQFAQGYSIMTSLAPSWTWGIVFLALGSANFFGVLRRKGDLVRSTSKLLSFLWFVTAFLFAWAALFSPGWILLLGIAILYGGVASEYRTKTKWHDHTDALGPDM